ncbi:MAG: leucyl aminopeptidase family protein, partial [Hyphomicrobiales bacterium]|nr:leucyl aminopeptidase family protein [Hyphomicrobiales bacterium]
MPPVLGDPTRNSIPIIPTSRAGLRRTLDALPAEARAYANAMGFDGAPGAHLVTPNGKGAGVAVLFGVAEPGAAYVDPMAFGRLATVLPRGRYRIAEDCDAPAHAELAFLLSAYKFARYRKAKPTEVVLEASRGPKRSRIESIAAAVALGRDLINTPANDLGPDALEQAATALAREHGARVKAVRGEQLLKDGFPLIHAVGKGAAEAPRLLDINWGPRKGGPKITLVGKGVCFDTGGLDLKPGASMLLMKKDMGGAATALAAAAMIMRAKLP